MGKTDLDITKSIYYEINKTVANNIIRLIEYKGLNANQVLQDIRKKDGYAITLPYLSRLLNHTDQTKMPLIFVMQCAEYFNVTVDDLLSECIDISKLERSNVQRNATVKISEIVERCNQESYLCTESMNSKILGSSVIDDSAFITNSSHVLFKSILQTYHCYFYPTASQETRLDSSILHGIFRIYNEQDKCKVELTINTSKKDLNKQTLVKTYKGYAIYSSATNSLYCILNDKIEYCFIIFRYHHLSYALQDCHMAMMLSSASATTDRYPTALRIFLSREEVEPKHIPLLAPHLKVNFSQISISDTELSSFKLEAPEYEHIINTMRDKLFAEKVYSFKERTVLSIASETLEGKELDKFITLLRSHSEAFHYIKVGNKANDTIRNLLKSLGYYSEDLCSN